MRTLRTNLNPTQSSLGLGLLIGLTAVVGGTILAFAGPIAAAAIFLAALAALIVLRDMEVGFWATIAVVTLLPFATLPFDIGLTPTFLDIALGAVLAVWIVGLITGHQHSINLSPLTLPLLIFIIIDIKHHKSLLFFQFIYNFNINLERSHWCIILIHVC